MKSIGGWAEPGPAETKSSMWLKNKLGASDLLLAIRDVDEVGLFTWRKKLWFAGLSSGGTQFHVIRPTSR